MRQRCRQTYPQALRTLARRRPMARAVWPALITLALCKGPYTTAAEGASGGRPFAETWLDQFASAGKG